MIDYHINSEDISTKTKLKILMIELVLEIFQRGRDLVHERTLLPAYT